MQPPLHNIDTWTLRSNCTDFPLHFLPRKWSTSYNKQYIGYTTSSLVLHINPKPLHLHGNSILLWAMQITDSSESCLWDTQLYDKASRGSVVEALGYWCEFRSWHCKAASPVGPWARSFTLICSELQEALDKSIFWMNNCNITIILSIFLWIYFSIAIFSSNIFPICLFYFIASYLNSHFYSFTLFLFIYLISILLL